MSKQELVDLYWEASDVDPTMLSDIYKNFYLFDRVELLIFENRLCSSILLTRTSEKALGELKTKLKDHFDYQIKNSPGWRGELEMSYDESLAILENSLTTSIGSTIITSVAALESLLIDLHPSNEELPEGLHNLLKNFLSRHKNKMSKSKRKHIQGTALTIGKRRNTFAHALDGSYWKKDPSIRNMFTQETMEDTLYKVCEIAVAIDKTLKITKPTGAPFD